MATHPTRDRRPTKRPAVTVVLAAALLVTACMQSQRDPRDVLFSNDTGRPVQLVLSEGDRTLFDHRIGDGQISDLFLFESADDCGGDRIAIYDTDTGEELQSIESSICAGQIAIFSASQPPRVEEYD